MKNARRRENNKGGEEERKEEGEGEDKGAVDTCGYTFASVNK